MHADLTFDGPGGGLFGGGTYARLFQANLLLPFARTKLQKDARWGNAGESLPI